MRLDRAGSIRLRVGPPQIAPKIQEKRVRNQTRFESLVFTEKSVQNEQNGLPNGVCLDAFGSLFEVLFRGFEKGALRGIRGAPTRRSLASPGLRKLVYQY